MADLKISQTPVKTTLDGADLIPIVDSGTATTKHITKTNAFLYSGLTDVTGAYTTGTALWKTNAAGTAIEETTTLFTEPAANQFKFARGTSALTMCDHDLFIIGTGSSAFTLTGDMTLVGSLNVESDSRVNQDLTTDAAVTFDGLTLTTTALTEGNGGTGETSYTDGQVLIGNTGSTGLDKATITGTADQVTVTNGAGTITLSTPQSINTTSTPTFNGLTLTSTTQALVVPVMTTTQKNGLAAQSGMIVYDSTLNKFQGFENGMWVSFI